MAASNVGRSSRAFCRWDLEAIVEAGGSCGERMAEAVRKIPTPNGDERPFCCDVP